MNNLVKTPIYDFVKKYKDENYIRAHMPGHKGKSFFDDPLSDAYLMDITEIEGADALFEADGIIAESESIASRIFETKKTVYSASGSTLSIQAMLLTACGINKKIIAGRNAHRSFINACALLNEDVYWVYPEKTSSCAMGKYSPKEIENALKNFPADAVYITSPDYLGNISDIKGISEICKKYNVKLIVDNAHGAYLKFCSVLHPIEQGADLCSDSAHKTLPVLTGGGYLHSGNKEMGEKLKKNMSVFASTSPSYLILTSLDLCNKYLDGNAEKEFKDTAEKLNEIKTKLSGVYEFSGDEPLKLTIHTTNLEITGYELSGYLRENKIECEYADNFYLVMMLSPFNSDDDFAKIKDTLENLKMPRKIIRENFFTYPRCKTGMSIREAMFSESVTINVDDALGRISSMTKTVCPPGIYPLVPGEIIDSDMISVLKELNISYVSVVKEDK